ncbi:MAG: hypothetical protein IKN54_01140 [Lachnospiraceae bacterium]|nr:hypothetical protein [Lachnospiraceae bacterium]
MANNYDNDIQLTVGVDADDALDTSEQLSESIHRMFDASVGQQLTTRLRSILSQFNGLETRADAIRNRMIELERARAHWTDPQRDEYRELGERLSQLNNQMVITRSRLEDLGAAGDRTANRLSNVFRQSESEKPEILNIIELLKIGFEQLIQRSVHLVTTLASITGGAILSGLRKLGDLAKNVAIKFAMIPVKTVIIGLRKIAQLAKTAAINLAKMIASPIINGAKSLAKNLLHIGKSSDSNNMSLKKGLRMFIRYGLGMRSLFALINKLRKALTDGLGQMAESFEPFGNVVSDFKNSIELLKGSVASVAAPILQQVLPVLTAFINKLSEGITMIGKFVVALQGKSMFVKATSAVADTGKKATKALKNTAKAAKEAQRELFSFDQINRFSSQNDSDTGSNTDTSDEDTPNITFEEVPIENAISELANKIRAFIQSEDWAGLGQFLGNSINSVFQKAKDLLTSQELYDKIDWFVNAITTTFNSLVSAVNWSLIGQTFAAGINLILYTINSLLTGIDWFNLGFSLAQGLMGLITDLNWPLLGQTLASYVNSWIDFIHGAITGFNFRLAAHNLMVALNNFIADVHWWELGATISDLMIGVLNFLSTAIQDFDWDNLATSIKEFLSGVDWNGIVEALSEFIGTAFGWGVKLQNFIWGIIKDAWDKMMEDWNKRVEDAGGDIWKALTGAIKEKFSGIWDWLKKHVVDPFMKGFNGLFGISSGYSSELKNAGSDLGEGMYRGILSKFSDLYNWIKSHMVDPVISNVETLFGINSTDGSSKFKSIGLQLIAGLWNGIQEAMNSIPGLLDDVFGERKQDGLLAKIMSIFDINSPSKKMFDIGGNLVKGLSNGIEQDTTFNSMLSRFTDLASSIEKSFNDINWSDIGTNICYGIQNGINSGWNWLQNTVTNMAYSLYNSARWALGIFSPSRVFRDGVGKMIPAGIAVGVDKNADTAISSINDLSKSIAGTDIQLPSIVAGKVVPYSSQGVDNSILNALNNLTDMLEYNQLDTISRTDLETIITTAIQRYGRIDFYIGDEQIARHANAGNVKLDKRYKPSIA